VKKNLVIYWCRRDFRLTDNPAFSEALEFAKNNSLEILPIYIIDDYLILNKFLNVGYSRRFLFSKILSSFDKSLDFNLNIFCGKTVDIFNTLLSEYELKVFVNDDIEPYSLVRDLEIKTILESHKSTFNSYSDQLTVNKDLRSGSGSVYSVFTPFRNSGLKNFLESKTYPQVNLDLLKKVVKNTLDLDSTITQKLLKKENSLEDQIFKIIDKKNNLQLNQDIIINLDNLVSRPDLSFWYSTETEALACLDDFVENKILHYKENRDDMGLDTFDDGQTSRLSTALKWGLVSSRSIKDKILEKHGLESSLEDVNIFAYISELMWREFYRYILFHNPSVLDLEFQKRFQGKLMWLEGDLAMSRFVSWIKGETGYPLVDAAMNQIAKTGWLHNRARMLVASILTKNLGIDWRWGQEYFRMVLVDLDEASNNGGWQWAASVGADPKPIRIFNPYLQAEKYDSKKLYQNKWLPTDYSIWQPLVDHKLARQEALFRYGLNTDSVRDF